MFKMLKLIAVLVLCEVHNTCYGNTGESDWRSRGWYRPRRNYASQSQNAFGITNAGYNQNTDDQKPGTALSDTFRSASYNQKQETQSPFGSFGQRAQAQNTFGTSYNQKPEQNSFSERQNAQSASLGINNGQNFQNTFDTRRSGSSLGNGFHSNAQNRKFGNSFSQNSRADYTQNTQSQNSFGNTQNVQNYNTFGANYNQQPQAQNAFGYRQNSQRQSAFGSYSQNAQSQNSFGSFGRNAFQFENVTSNNLSFGSASSSFARGQSVYKGPEYLPPLDKRKPPYIAPGYLPSKDPTTTTRIPFYTTTTTRRPFFPTTTRRPYYTQTTTTKRPKRPNPIPSPAMAMPVPPEPEDDDNTSLIPDNKIMIPTGQVAPAMAMPVPPEPEDDDNTSLIPDNKIMIPTGQVAPAMAMPVPPEPEDDPPLTAPPPTTTTTTPPQTTTTTTTTTPPPTTTTTTPLPTTTTTIPPPTRTTPPLTTTTPPPTTPPPTTPPPTTTTPPSTTTTPPSTTTTIATPVPDRMLIEETPKTTTTAISRTIPTTVPPTYPYKAPEYLPPKDPYPPPELPPSPAMAIPVPPEPECDPLDPSTYPYPLGVDVRSSGVDPCTYVPVRTTTKKPFVGPAYLPPTVNARVGRSPKTLRLEDVMGARPVWHAGLYTKTTRPFKQICGGSVIRMDVVITAAHCVWNDDTLLEPAENYAVGANKVYRPWTEPHDKRAQQSDVREIIVPPRYRGGKTSFQDDIAILKLVTPFSYARGLRPVCISFDDDFDMEQLAEGNSGTVAGWGYTDDVGSPTQYLLWLELPYVDIEKCIAGADDAFLKYITSDKICAGENHTGKALCKGDSGGGLVFWHGEGDLVTPYLRGVASASARADNKECNVNVVGGFTQIAAHRRFLQRHVPEVDLNCRYHYTN